MLKSIKELGEYIESETNFPTRRSKLGQVTGKLRELYDLILLKSILDDKELFKLLYPTGKKKTYSKLKERLYLKLIDIAFKLESHSEKLDFARVRERSIKLTAMLKILLFRGIPFNVVEMSKKLINVCLRYEFNDLLLEILLINLELYGRGYQNESKFYRMQVLYDKILPVVQLENEIQIKYFQYFVDYATSNKLRQKDTIGQLRLDEQFLLNIVEKKQSAKSTIFAFNALCVIYELLGEYYKIVECANQALRYIHSKPQDSNALQLSYLQKRFRAQLKLRRKDDLFVTLKDIELRDRKFSISYYQTSLYKMLMWCHDRNYAEVLAELNKVYFGSSSERIPTNIREYFNIIHGFIALLMEAEVFELKHVQIEKFRVYKFINEVPLFSKDKKGVNISILILHVLFMLQRRRFDDILDRSESLQLYSYRYLRKDDTFRSNCFIKMIIQMTKANFHPVRTERYTTELLKKLIAVPLALSEQPLEVEIIPYEHLWEIVMQLLERNSKIKRGRPKKNID